MKIDLRKFSLQTAGIHPYFKIVPEDHTYHVFEGAIGNNRYQHLVIEKDSAGGELCKNYIEKYVVRNEHRFNVSDDIAAIIQTILNQEPIDRIAGLNAYRNYWFSLTEEERGSTYFNLVITHESIAFLAHKNIGSTTNNNCI